MPTIFRSVKRPGHWSGMEIVVGGFEWRMITKDGLDHLRVAVPRRPVQRRAAMLPGGIHWQPGSQHQANGRQIIIPSSVSCMTTVGLRKISYQIGMIFEHRFHRA